MYAQFDVVVVPSLWHETASLIIQEAWATGAPVIVSDLGAMPEFVQTGVNGAVFPAGDVEALAEILRGLLVSRGKVSGWNAGILPVRTIVEHVDDIEKVYGHVNERY